MPRLNRLIIAGSLCAIAMAQSNTVTQVFLPFADQQPLVASVVGSSGDVNTLAIQCKPDTPADECGFPEPCTVTVGPSTFHLNPTGIWQAIGELDCKITGTTEAACALTAGLYSTRTDGDFITTPAESSSTTSATVSGTEANFVAVTITAGALGTGSGSGSPATSASASSSSVTGSGSAATGTASRVSGTAASSASAAATATGNGADRTGMGMVALPLSLSALLLLLL